jgi:hypothetical protein
MVVSDRLVRNPNQRSVQMFRSATSKVVWVGKTASIAFGLALVVALVLGVTTVALAAVPGDPFRLGTG